MPRCTIVTTVGTIIALVVGTAAVATASVPAQISYQGVLTDASGTPVADGSYSVTFRMYAAPAGGMPIWQETEVVTTSGGLFTKVLGNTVSLAGLAFDRPYWLGISVDGGSELPRQALLAGPYAMRAAVADSLSLPFAATADTASALVDVTNASATGEAIRGTVTSTTSTAAAVHGVSNSQAAFARAVTGAISSTTPGPYSAGVYGASNGTSGNGIGVWGSHNGTGWGVYGTSKGRAVYGATSGTGPSAAGVVGQALSAGSGTGVEAIGPPGGTGDALTITDGALRVRGAGAGTATTAFIHVATLSNLDATGNRTYISHPMLDGHPEMLVLATPMSSFAPPAHMTGGLVGTGYDAGRKQWFIFSYQDDNFGQVDTIIAGARFTVLIIRP